MCFFGKVRTNTLDEVISTDAMHAQVTVVFELVDGATYKMERTIPRVGSQEARIFVKDESDDSGWRPLTERGARENTAYLVNLLGTDYETATTTWLALQGDYGKFSNAKPAERYGLLSGIFGLEEYAPLHAAANRRLGAAQMSVSEADARIGEIETTLANKPDQTVGEFGEYSDEQLDAEAAREQAAADAVGSQIAELAVGDPARARDELASTLSRVRAHRQGNLAQAETRLRDLSGQHSRVEQTIASTKGALARIAAAEDEIGAFAGQRSDLTSRMEALQASIATNDQAAATHTATARSLAVEWTSLGERHETAVAKIDGLQKAAPGHAAECFTCGQHLSEADAARLIEEQRAEIAAIESRRAEVTSLGKSEKEAAAAATQTATAARNEGRGLQQKFDALNSREGELRTLIGGKESAQAALDEAEGEAARLSGEVSAAKDAVASLGVATEEEATLAARLREAEITAQTEAAETAARRAELLSTQGRHLTRVRTIDQEKITRQHLRQREAEMLERLDVIRDARAEAAKSHRLMSVLAKAFSPAGIPAMILTGVVQEIGEEVNVALDSLSNGQLSVDIRASKETRSGGIQQKITIYVDAPDGTRSYETLSGGQKFRVDLAIRAGLNKVISRRTGTPIETFIIDEGWGMLDESGIMAAVDTMERLSKDLTVLTVSHIDTVKSTFPTVFEVEMKSGTSTVTRTEQ